MAQNGDNIPANMNNQEQNVVLGAGGYVPLPAPAAAAPAPAYAGARPRQGGRGRGQQQMPPPRPGLPVAPAGGGGQQAAEQVLLNAQHLPFARDHNDAQSDKSALTYASKRVTRSAAASQAGSSQFLFGEHTIKTTCVFREIHKDTWAEHMPGVPFFTFGRQAVIRGDNRFRYDPAQHNYVLEAVPNLRQPNGGVLPGPAIATPIGGYYPHQHLVLRHDYGPKPF
ncbi:hypothetical protein TKK_0009131 [Trichogramma kaykai]